MTTLTAHPARAISECPGRVWLLAAALGIAFFVAEQNWQISRMEDFAMDVDQMEAGAAQGSLVRQVGFSLVALVGAACFARRPRYTLALGDPLALLVMLCLSWCLASVAWSGAPAFTAKRLAILAFCFLASLGLCRQLSLRQLVLVVLAVSSTYALAGIGVELALGTFRPWSGEYRFAGTMHPNGQGVNCAILCLAAASLCRRPLRRNWLPLALLAAGGLLLLLTRSRTAAAAASIALLVLAAATKGSVRAKLSVVFLAAFALCAAAWTLSILGYDVQEKFVSVVLLGREGDAEALNGRLPLWTELVSGYVARRPLCGYGYNTFWDPQHIDDLSSTFFWGIREAHSAYVEVLLSVGAIGMAALLATVAVGVARSLGAYRTTGEGAYGFVLGMLVFGLVSSITESGFVLPEWASFVAACGIVGLACRPIPGGSPEIAVAGSPPEARR